MALIDPNHEEEILASVKEKYLEAFPSLADKYAAFICESADGIKLD